jgi:hypothetical protein
MFLGRMRQARIPDFGLELKSVKFTSEREAAPRYYRKWLWAEIGKSDNGDGRSAV